MGFPIFTAAYTGLTPRLLSVESSFVSGFAKLQVVGNVGDISRDGSERVRAALERINQPLPSQRVVVSVTPSETPKEGNHFDLPVAISLLQLISPRKWQVNPSRWLFAGELALDGHLRGTRGGIAFATVALKKGLNGLIVPRSNLRELRIMQSLNPDQFGNLELLGFDDLGDVRAWLETGEPPTSSPGAFEDATPIQDVSRKTFDDMHLTPELQRLACVIAVGRHSCLLRGSPGCGKTMFAERLPALLPVMAPDEHLQALSVQTAACTKVPSSILAGYPPFRAPHHQASSPSLIGTIDRPGELSLAHGGILFLDEFPEFRRDVIEALREPLETGWVHVSRAKLATTWCAKVILIAAANNCPCGWFGSTRKKCGCPMSRIRSYRDKLSGPILDRIDLHIDMPEPARSTSELFYVDSETLITETLRAKVKDTLTWTRTRNEKLGIFANRDIPPHLLLQACNITPTTLDQWLHSLTEGHHIGPRGAVRLLRVARTLADLDGDEDVTLKQIKEAWSWHSAGAAYFRGDRFYGL